MKQRCAFLVGSCDAYADTWDIYFDLVNIYWHDIQYPIYLNTETVPYKPVYDYPFKVNVINTSKTIEWSRRMLKVLDAIEEDYVLLVLDDYFLQSPVNVKVIEELMDKMDADPTIASCQLTAAKIAQEQNIQPGKDLQMNLLPDNAWKALFIPTIWRKSTLKKWLRPWETIWAFELCGSRRARMWYKKDKVYTIDSPMVFDYLWIEGCSAIVNGKWYASDEIDKFFVKNNLTVDLSKRGRITMEQYRINAQAKSIVQKYSFSQVIVKCFNRFRSLF